ncbi:MULTISPECIES: hydantoinase B/oxoprolinase family protein [Methylobacterium]|uniref:N-methylhydantoinase n=2 Tax=Methylobacterium TaxID=407 RepID=A0A0C6FIC0_9HYPH|nr:hydantoinase B/oxoprolinase family protein [Methylobacterium aquaticum]BAQ44839.1 N-methylhydantoinase [Methylobacterium aquaticum]
MRDIDPIRLEVMKNAFDTIADEMALILMRAAHSPIVRDSMDFSTALCDPEGQTLAQGVTTPMHLGSFYDAMRHLITRYAGDVHEGDTFIGNDPYAAAGQHLPDFYIVQPIFLSGRLVGWATTVAHHADVGGIVPGSNALGATEIIQEGIRVPFLKLEERGRPDAKLWEMLRLNVRVPDQLTGDLNAQIAACAAARRGLTELMTRYSVEEVLAYAEELHDYTERLTRAEIREIPDGTYRFTDHIDGLGETPEPIVFEVAVTVAGDAITIDWEGTSAQVEGGVNTPLPFTKAGVYTALRSIMGSELPNCHGFTRAVTVTAPLGTVVNAVYPAPTGARGITGYRIIDCVIAALAPVLPDRVTADGPGGASVPAIGGWHDGRPFVFSETLMGCWGAARGHDGQEGVPHMGANQANVPVELIEANFPIRVRRYGIAPDTGGPGRQRGGHALLREYEFLGESGVLTLRSDKRDFPPHGLDGGEAGSGPVNRVLSGDAERTLPVLVTVPVRLRRGDIFLHVTPSGGGWGDPLTRDPALVLQDVIDEKVSRAAARARYGVVIAGEDRPCLDLAATAALRREGGRMA